MCFLLTNAVVVPTYRTICPLQRNGLPTFEIAKQNASKLESPFVLRKHNLVREEVRTVSVCHACITSYEYCAP